MCVFRAFRRDRGGAVALVFGLSLLPLALAAGAAVDYSRATSARTVLQTAVDSTALALARDATILPTEADMASRGQAYFYGVFAPRGSVVMKSLTIARSDKTVKVSAAASVATAFMGIVSVDQVAISAEAESAWGTRHIELAMVLDNTGSMAAKGKMTALKQAATDLLATLEKAATDKDSFKVSIIPFDTQVNLGTGVKTASWLGYNLAGLDPKIVVDQIHWAGCVTDRDQPYDVDDTLPTIGNPKTLYPAVKCATAALAQMRPLTNDFNALRNTINAMTPSGNTDVTVGVVWGLASLSQSDPLTEGQPYGAMGVDKMMIVLTDGDNTQNRFTTATSQIDDRTRLACAEVKRNNVRVYTIRVIDGNANLLRDCATSASMYYDVKDASQLGPVFQGIANEIAAIRLTQ